VVTIASHLHRKTNRYGANVTLRLSVMQAAWRAHVSQVLAESPFVVPVVKGNGYGFGRTSLIAELAEVHSTTLTPFVAVGTVHELDPATTAALAATGSTPVVLTPTLRAPSNSQMVLTVGSSTQIEALAGWKGRVLVKLVSAMQRYGGDLSLINKAQDSGLEVIGVSVHPPLPAPESNARESGPADLTSEVTNWLKQVPTEVEVWVSHLSAEQFAGLPTTHRYRHRIGTRLWHGDKSMLSLTAEVHETRAVRAGALVGYRQVRVASDGHLIMIGAGSAHGVRPLPDGRSPFHFDSQRIDLVELPHMHTSMAFIPTGRPRPRVGDQVDVQNPLTQVLVDQVTFVEPV
jgi:alanine racemase